MNHLSINIIENNEILFVHSPWVPNVRLEALSFLDIIKQTTLNHSFLFFFFVFFACPFSTGSDGYIKKSDSWKRLIAVMTKFWP